jgi:glucose-1-phosphate thymidylyltransferase
MKALILGAGYAVRLYPLTLNTPKPLLEVGGKKIIDRIIAKISVIKGLDEIYVVTNHRFYANFEQWALGCRYGQKISVIDDGTSTNETRLGAIRDMELSIKEKSVNDDLLVVAGDNLFEMKIESFIDFASTKRTGASVALYDVGSIEAAKRYGVVSIDKSGKVTEFEEKPKEPKSTLISTGVYYFPRERVSDIDRYLKTEGMKNDAPGYYIKWLSANGNVYGFSFSEKWYDIGDIESYKKADEEYKKKEKI